MKEKRMGKTERIEALEDTVNGDYEGMPGDGMTSREQLAAEIDLELWWGRDQ